MRQLITFETTHHALWAEQVALESGLGVQVVQAPKESGSLCAIALESLPEDLAALRQALDAVGISYKLFVAGSA